MRTISKKDWFLLVVYGLALAFMLVTASTSIGEDQELLKVGFEFVTERNGIKLYRRPKIFAKYMDKR